jgi:hypothetical protein
MTGAIVIAGSVGHSLHLEGDSKGLQNVSSTVYISMVPLQEIESTCYQSNGEYKVL